MCAGRQKLNTQGRCEECGKYTSPTHDRKECKNNCKGTQTVLEDGSCEDSDESVLEELLNEAGCPDFTRMQEDGECRPNECLETEKVTKFGGCTPCDDF